MALRIVQVTADRKTYTGRPIAKPTAIAVAKQVGEAMAGAGSHASSLITFGETDGFEHTVLRVIAITGVQVIEVDDPGLDGDQP